MTYWIRPVSSHLKMGAEAGPTANPYPEDSHAGLLWASGNAFTNGTPEQASTTLKRARKIREELKSRLPEIDELSTRIGIPFSKWRGNCATIVEAILPHLDLGHPATPAYGFYTGEIDSKSMFAGRGGFARHAWIETLDGMVIDPTRWVFNEWPPYLFVGTIENYDYGMMNFNQDLERPEPAGKTSTITLSQAAADIVTKLTGVANHNGAVTMSYSTATWLTGRPIEYFGSHYIEILDALDDQSQAWIPHDAKVWIDANRPTINEAKAA